MRRTTKTDYGIRINEKYGRWKVLETEVIVPRGTRNLRFARCVCECGTERLVSLQSLSNGSSKSCGCLNREKIRQKSTRHNYANHVHSGRWYNMMARCYNPGAGQFKDWGGRGITVCEAWHDIGAFCRWLDENLGPCPKGMSLDRIDNDGNYEPGNVRWADRATQVNNRRCTPTEKKR